MSTFLTREEAVLKLVHPGGIVETHHHAVAASQVMDKNPRHFVTRPDVFKFPWLVVRPESMLKPGQVFFIVPCHTLHRLLRSSGSPQQRILIPPRLPQMLQRPAEKVMMVEQRRVGEVGERMLKSCLKKNNSTRFRARRVEFMLPEPEGEKQQGENVVLTLGGVSERK